MALARPSPAAASLPLLAPAAPDCTSQPWMDAVQWARAEGSLVAFRADARALAPEVIPLASHDAGTSAPLAVLLSQDPLTSAGEGPRRAEAHMMAMLPQGLTTLDELAARQGRPQPQAESRAEVTEPTEGMATVDLGDISVVYDEEQLVLRTPALVRRGITIAPLREIFERTDGVLYWYPVEKRVRAVGPRATVGLKIGDKTAQVNGEPKLLQLEPFIKRGRTMVPAAFLAEALDVVIKFDPESKRILITSTDY
jgi:hypothetical protein